MDSFISWIGGKKLLRKELLASMPQTKIDSYIEVFGGAAWLLFAKESHAKLEVYNDLDSDLVNLFKCVKYHPEELERNLLLLNSRELFADLKAKQKPYMCRVGMYINRINGLCSRQKRVEIFLQVYTNKAAFKYSLNRV